MDIIFPLIIILLIVFILVGYFRQKKWISTKRQLEEVKSALQKAQTEKQLSEQSLLNYQQQCKILSNTEKELIQRCEQRKKEIEDDFLKLKEDKERILQAEYELASRDYELKKASIASEVEALNIKQQNARADYEEKVKGWETIYIGLIEPKRKMEESKEERTAYCLKISEADAEDINFLLQEVGPKIKNKDLIPKLVWGEYVQKPLAALLTKYKISELPGIYKLTNINDDKAYIGKSVNVKKRIQDHFKAACGISSISDQKIHHAMLEQGLGNWQVEIVCYCSKEELGEKEKFYIEKFGTQSYGWNVASGG